MMDDNNREDTQQQVRVGQEQARAARTTITPLWQHVERSTSGPSEETAGDVPQDPIVEGVLALHATQRKMQETLARAAAFLQEEEKEQNQAHRSPNNTP